MKTGTQFWQLIAWVFVILSGYALAELHDAVEAKEKQLNSGRQLLIRQQAMLRDNRWVANLRAIEPVRQAWIDYLPHEDSAAISKANLLREMHTISHNAGVPGLTVLATDAENEANFSSPVNTSLPAYGSKSATAKPDELPSGVQVIRLQITGRFEPVSFAKLLRALKDEKPSAIIERVSVHGAQLELNMRYYWRLSTYK